MTKANGHVIQMVFTLMLLQVPASSQEPTRETSQPPSAQTSRSVDAQDEKAAEQKLWDSIKNGSDPQKYKTFLEKYPHGQFDREARSRLSALLGPDYVTLFTKRSTVNKQWSNVEKQLARRADVAPRLYETLLAAGVQEPKFFGQLARDRAGLLTAMYSAPQGDGEAKTPEQKQEVIDADNSFGKTLRRLDSLVENYPPLRSNERFLKVEDELAGVENRIAVARLDYNSAVQDYQTTRKESRMTEVVERYGFTEEPYFKSEKVQPLKTKKLSK
jgi:LemA protein